jgi:hypothetical protein
MNEFHNDDELMALLGDVFLTQAIEPDEAARQQLRDALASDNLVAFATAVPRGTALRRRLRSHLGLLTLSAAGVLVVGGVAAAAVSTNTLPGPTRAIAYDLGLPVTSPALYHARQQLHQLDSANTQHDTKVAHHLGHGLLHDLKLLNHSDLSQISQPAKAALTKTGLLPQVLKILGVATSTTTTTEAHSGSTSTTTTTTPVLPTLPILGKVTGSSDSKSGPLLKSAASNVKSVLP